MCYLGKRGQTEKLEMIVTPRRRGSRRERVMRTPILHPPAPHTHKVITAALLIKVLFSCCVAESESTAVHMVEEMSLLQETVEQSRAAEESSFIEPSFTHAEPPESKVRKVHTLKLCSLSKHVVINCVWYKFCCQIPFKLDFNVALKCTQIVTSLLFYTAKKTQKPS